MVPFRSICAYDKARLDNLQKLKITFKKMGFRASWPWRSFDGFVDRIAIIGGEWGLVQYKGRVLFIQART